MAKINLTTQHNQENLSTLSSLGVLICMIVTVVGIKLWWFKHRLSFEPKNSQHPSSSANRGSTPAVLVPGRSKQPKYKKDKRYSQQVYESVEIHGVFRQKPEDDLEIQRAPQLPPVRIRQTSESDAFVIRPPRRTKRRDQVHSTAFEDLEIATHSVLATASSSDLSVIPEINTKITLTFEEFERQFNLKELNTTSAQSTSTNNERMNKIPKPPLRLNRSSSSMVKPEKPERHLKLSQSITVPEFHKGIEKKTVGHSSPKEDLTKIDIYDEAKLFENFAQPKVTTAGYIKYEEVDNDLQERELNAEADKEVYNFVDNGGFYESRRTTKDLKNERTSFDNDINESSSDDSTNEINFNRKADRTKEWQEVDFLKKNLIMKDNESKQFQLKDAMYYANNEYRSGKTISPNGCEQDSLNFEKNYVTESKIVKKERTSENNGDHFVNKQEANEFVKEDENATMMANKNAELLKRTDIFDNRVKTDNENNCHVVGNETVAEFNSANNVYTNDEYVNKTRSVDDKKSAVVCQKSFTETSADESPVSFDEDLDSQYESWPQFEEKIETPQVTVRRFNNHHLQLQSSFDENDILETSSSYSHTNEKGKDNAKAGLSSLKERRPTGNEKYRPESPEFEEIEEWQEAFNNKFYNHVRSFITAEESSANFAGREVSFATSVLPQSENKSNETSAVKKRRPTGYIKRNEHFVTLNDDSDEDTNDGGLRSYLDANTIHLPKVKFEDDNLGLEHETDKFTLNQRRPTGFVSLLNRDETDGMFEGRVTFNETTVFKDTENIEDSLIKQRRPTGFIKKLEILDLSDNETSREDSLKEYDKRNRELKNEQVSQNCSTVRFMEAERNFETTEESLVKQRRPTGYIRQEVTPDSPIVSFLETDKHFEDSGHKTVSLARPDVSPDSPTVRFLEVDKYTEDYETKAESLVKQRRPTGYGHQEVLFKDEKQVSFELDIDNNETTTRQNEALQQRRPTGFVRKDEIIKQVNFQSAQEDEKSKNVNEKLKQRRPTGYVSRKELNCLEQTVPLYQPSNDDNSKQDFDDHLWQELEKEVAQDVMHNLEEEFAKIRHSYELNEADFLELKDELQKSPTDPTQQPLGFGKSIEDDWENFEQLKNQVIIKPLPMPEEKIKITFSDNDLTNTTSILKDTKLEEDMQPKPRKSKVTFDFFKTEEHVIPARKSHNNSEEDSDFDDEYNKTPPQPLKRSSNINYNNEKALSPIVSTSTSIMLFGSQITTEDNEPEDSWSAIRKHRNMTNALHNFSTDSRQQTMPLSMPPKPAYRNPMAQLVIQQAKEARADIYGFKSRSINDRKPEPSNRQKQKLFNLSNVDHEEGTEA